MKTSLFGTLAILALAANCAAAPDAPVGGSRMATSPGRVIASGGSPWVRDASVGFCQMTGTKCIAKDRGFRMVAPSSIMYESVAYKSVAYESVAYDRATTVFHDLAAPAAYTGAGTGTTGDVGGVYRISNSTTAPVKNFHTGYALKNGSPGLNVRASALGVNSLGSLGNMNMVDNPAFGGVVGGENVYEVPAEVAGMESPPEAEPLLSRQLEGRVGPRVESRAESDRTGRALWIASIAALAAANLADARTSWGKDEGNRALAGAGGRFGAKGAAIKGGVNAACVVGQVIALRRSRSHRTMAIANFVAAAVFGAIAYRNSSIGPTFAAR